VFTPVPRIKSPTEVIGDNALNAVDAVVCPVPPLAIGRVPVTPVVKGNPVQLVNVPDEGVPRAGVTNVGLVANTRDPDPVSSDTADAKLALVGVPKNVATLAPKPLTPVEIGNPVQLVSVPDVGVPNAGVTNDGDVSRTTLPDPVVAEEEAAVSRPCASTVKLLNV
jgi:hypothetical protein